MSKLDSRDLHLVQQIAELGSLTAAAEQLHVTQSAVSQRLAKLQQRLGAQLFDRKNGQMQTTAAGQLLVEAASNVNRELERVAERVTDLTAHRQQRLLITTQCHTLYRWLPFVLRDMHALHADLNIDVIPEATDRAYDALARDQVDLALISGPREIQGFVEEALFTDEFYAVMSRDHPLAGLSYLQPADFTQQTLVLYTGPRHRIVDEILEPAGVVPGRIIQMRITEAIVELVRAGRGMAILTGWAYNDIDHAGLARVRITEAGMRRPWRAVLNPQCPNHLAQSLVQLIRQTGEKLHQNGWRKTLSNSASQE